MDDRPFPPRDRAPRAETPRTDSPRAETPRVDAPWPRRFERERLERERAAVERERLRVRAAGAVPPQPPRRPPAEQPPGGQSARPAGPPRRTGAPRRDPADQVTRITPPLPGVRPDEVRTRPVPHTPAGDGPLRGRPDPVTGRRTGRGDPPSARPAGGRVTGAAAVAGLQGAGPKAAASTTTASTTAAATTATPKGTGQKATGQNATGQKAAGQKTAGQKATASTAGVPRAAGDAERTARPTPPPVRRTGRRRPRTLGLALLATAAATAAPGSGHLMLHRRRTGWLILGPFLLGVVTVVGALATLRRSDLLTPLLSSGGLAVATVVLVAVAVAWIAVIVRTWVLAQPRRLDPGRRAVGVAVVTALCLLVATPLGFAANLANSSRSVLGELFADDAGAADLGPRVNVLLVGSDAGPDRTGTRTDTMMVASIETATGRTTLFSLPRNISYAQFPPGSPMAEEFPDGFHDSAGPDGNYYLNAVYAYGHEYPDLAPAGPTADPGLNLLHQTVSYMLDLDLDYYVELDMAGFAAIIDSLGGVRVDVGPDRIPIGGISPNGREVRPTGYIEPGIQQLDGENALAFARSRTNSTDYVRMGRQRCLIQNILDQNQPAELLTNFQSIARATTDSVSTDIPQQALPALLSVADGPIALESVAFDPNLPDPEQSDGRFNTGDPDFDLMRQVVREALDRDPATAPPVAAADPSDIPETNQADDDTATGPTDDDTDDDAPLTSVPVSVAQSC